MHRYCFLEKVSPTAEEEPDKTRVAFTKPISSYSSAVRETHPAETPTRSPYPLAQTVFPLLKRNPRHDTKISSDTKSAMPPAKSPFG